MWRVAQYCILRKCPTPRRQKAPQRRTFGGLSPLYSYFGIEETVGIEHYAPHGALDGMADTVRCSFFFPLVASQATRYRTSECCIRFPRTRLSAR